LDRKTISCYTAVIYAVSTIALTWLFFLPNVLADSALATKSLLLLRLIAGFIPGIMSIVIIRFTAGRRGVKELLSRTIAFSGKQKWVITALVLPLLVVAIPVVVLLFMDILAFRQFDWMIWLKVLANFCLSLVLFGSIPDELGWRGLVLPALQTKYSALKSSVLIGLLWGLWQLPTYYFNDVLESLLSPIWLFIESVALSIVLTWLYNSSKSLGVVILFNAMYRTITQFLLTEVQVSYYAYSFHQFYTCVLVNVAIVLLLFCGGKTLVFQYSPRKDLKKI